MVKTIINIDKNIFVFQLSLSSRIVVFASAKILTQLFRTISVKKALFYTISVISRKREKAIKINITEEKSEVDLSHKIKLLSIESCLEVKIKT